MICCNSVIGLFSAPICPVNYYQVNLIQLKTIVFLIKMLVVVKDFQLAHLNY